MINIIIYSMNRACQLELLLRSLKHYFAEWDQASIKVIYRCTNDAGIDDGSADNPYYQGYRKCFRSFSEVRFLPEPMCRSFKDATITCLESENPLTMFLVDDIVFKEPFSLLDPEFQEFCNDQSLLTLSLRLYDGITHCYPINKDVSVPEFIEKNKWEWFGKEGDWGYPLSLDGHVFYTSFIKELTQQIPFTNPNSFESNLSQVAPMLVQAYPKMSCYKKNSKLLNVPANRVQNTFANRTSNSIEPKELNELFLSGKRIMLEPFKGIYNRAPHTETTYMFENEPQ